MRLFGKGTDYPKVEIVIGNQTVVRLMVMVVLIILGLAALRQAGHALLLIFLAFFLALALNGPVHWIAQHLPGKRRGSRVMATSISYVVVIAGLILLIATFVPPALRQTASFVADSPALIENLHNQDSPLGIFIRDYNLEDAATSLSKELGAFIGGSGEFAVSTVGAVGTSLVSIITVLAMTFMMLVEGPRWARLLLRFVPKNRQAYASRLTGDMYGVVRGFVNGQVVLAAIAALMILPVLLILGVPYAGALAGIVFICGLIPMIGHIIGATIVTIMALFNSFLSAILILSFYVLYQQIENYVIQPRVQANTTKISPLLVIIAVVIGINVNGIIGGLVAIPIMGCLRIIAIDYLQATGRLGKNETNVHQSHLTGPKPTPSTK
jgi:predicted PurR-regulated permease PerM